MAQSNVIHPPFTLDPQEPDFRDAWKGPEIISQGIANPRTFTSGQLQGLGMVEIRTEMLANRLTLTKGDEQMRWLLKFFYRSKLAKVEPEENGGKKMRSSKIGEENAFWFDAEAKKYHGAIFEHLTTTQRRPQRIAR